MSSRKREPDYDDINREQEDERPVSTGWEAQRSRAERNFRAGRLDEHSYRRLTAFIDRQEQEEIRLARNFERAYREWDRTDDRMRRAQAERRSRFLEWLLFDRPLGEGER